MDTQQAFSQSPPAVAGSPDTTTADAFSALAVTTQPSELAAMPPMSSGNSQSPTAVLLPTSAHSQAVVNCPSAANATPDTVAPAPGNGSMSAFTPTLRTAMCGSQNGAATPEGRHTPVSFSGSVNHVGGIAGMGSHPMTPVGPPDMHTITAAGLQMQPGGTPYRAPSPSNMSVNSGVGGFNTPQNARAGSCNLIVSDLPRAVKHATLRKHCERFGTVVSINVKMESRPRPSAKAFILFGDASAAARARGELHQSVIDGQRISAFPANQARGAVPCATLFVRFIPQGISSPCLHAFFSGFMPLRTARVRAQKAQIDHSNPHQQQPEYQEAVVEFYQTVPESAREAIADCDTITDYQTGGQYRLDTPLVVKYDEPESIRVNRNEAGGNRSGHNSGAGSPTQYAGAPPAQMHQQQPPASSMVSVPLEMWLPHNVVNGLVVLPPGASFVNVNGIDCVNLPQAAAQQFLAQCMPQAQQPPQYQQHQQPQHQQAPPPQYHQAQPQHHQTPVVIGMQQQQQLQQPHQHQHQHQQRSNHHQGPVHVVMPNGHVQLPNGQFTPQHQQQLPPQAASGSSSLPMWMSAPQ